MSALTQDTLSPVRVKRALEQVAERRHEAEKLLDRPLPPRPVPAAAAVSSHDH